MNKSLNRSQRTVLARVAARGGIWEAEIHSGSNRRGAHRATMAALVSRGLVRAERMVWDHWTNPGYDARVRPECRPSHELCYFVTPAGFAALAELAQ